MAQINKDILNNYNNLYDTLAQNLIYLHRLSDFSIVNKYMIKYSLNLKNLYRITKYIEINNLKGYSNISIIIYLYYYGYQIEEDNINYTKIKLNENICSYFYMPRKDEYKLRSIKFLLKLLKISKEDFFNDSYFTDSIKHLKESYLKVKDDYNIFF